MPGAYGKIVNGDGAMNGSLATYYGKLASSSLRHNAIRLITGLAYEPRPAFAPLNRCACQGNRRQSWLALCWEFLGLLQKGIWKYTQSILQAEWGIFLSKSQMSKGKTNGYGAAANQGEYCRAV